MNRKESHKASRELHIFREFCDALRLPFDLSSVENLEPPRPDLKCLVAGRPRCIELVEITDQQSARRRSVSLKTKRVTGGAFSSTWPLFRALAQKADREYQTDEAPLFLLAYYDRQVVPLDVDPDIIRREISGVAQQMVTFAGWAGIWLYETETKRLLWEHPSSWRGAWE